MIEQPSLSDPNPDDNHTPDQLDTWELELTGVLKAHDDDGNELPGVHLTPELLDKLTDRLFDHWAPCRALPLIPPSGAPSERTSLGAQVHPLP